MVVIPCRNNFDQAFIQNLNAHIGYRDQTFKIKNQHKNRKSNMNNKSFCSYDSYSWPNGWTKWAKNFAESFRFKILPPPSLPLSIFKIPGATHGIVSCIIFYFLGGEEGFIVDRLLDKGHDEVHILGGGDTALLTLIINPQIISSKIQIVPLTMVQSLNVSLKI